MALSLTHTFVSAKSDDADTTLIRPSNWNAEHTITAAACSVLGRSANSSGAVADIAASADGQFLRRASGALGFGAIAAGDLPAGTIVDRVFASYATNANVGTVAIPWDDTIPQNTEGTEILTATITPKTTTNRLRIRFRGQFYVVGNSRTPGVAIFQDSTAGALFASLLFQGWGTPMLGNGGIEWEFVPGSTSSTTIKIRVGVADTTGLYLNGVDTGRSYGGVSAATLIVEEFAAS